MLYDPNQTVQFIDPGTIQLFLDPGTYQIAQQLQKGRAYIDPFNEADSVEVRTTPTRTDTLRKMVRGNFRALSPGAQYVVQALL